MTCISFEHKLLVATAPKMACTSIKHAFFELENGFRFRRFRVNGEDRHIHNKQIYPGRPFVELPHDRMGEFFKITLVRNPVRRFLSAYSNRVGYYGELSARHVGDSGLPANPDIHTFIELFEQYREISTQVRRHTRTMTFFLGHDPSYFDRIFNFTEFSELARVVGKQVGKPFNITHEQAGGTKVDIAMLSGEQIDKIKSWYPEDYRAFGDYFEELA